MGSKAVKFKDNSGNTVYPCPYYPVGSIYMSVNNINPANFFGGTWERLKGRFLLGADDSTYKLGDTGGEAEHTLTINEIPSHNHSISAGYGSGGGYGNDRLIFEQNLYAQGIYDNGSGGIKFIQPTGGEQAHNNIPPYLSVYMWKRTA